MGQLQSNQCSFNAVVSLSGVRTCSTEPAVSGSSNNLPPEQIEENPPVILPHGMSTHHNDIEGGRSDSDDEISLHSYDDELSISGYVQPSESDNHSPCLVADVFHEINKVGRTISRKHSLHHEFHTAFSDTILVPDKGDRAKMEAFLTKEGSKWEKVHQSKADWLWKQVRRYIPEKSLHYYILNEFFNAWGNVICTVTKQPLFNAESWKKAKGVLHDVKKGWISDPKGIPIYTITGYDKNGLALYHCIRGTNSVEGGVHNPIRRSFESLNASVELADCLMADFRHRHNLDVGTVHKTGSQYQGHHDPWLDHEIS